MKTLSEQLRDSNLKVTPQRLAIYDMLVNTDKHPTAETIYKAVGHLHPSMSLATVYKTLDKLKKANLIREINLGEGSCRYDANNTAHAHLTCVECSSVCDFNPELNTLDSIRNELLQTTGFKISTEQFFFYGICKDCQKK